jgi:hypothetical protein
MTKEVTNKADDKITKDTISTIIGRAIASLKEAKTHSEKLAAINTADMTFDALDKAKKLHKDLEFELETAKAELVIVIDRVKIEIYEEYEKAKKNGDVATGSGKPTHKKSVVPEPRELPNHKVKQPSQKDIKLISSQRLSETRKVVNFDKKNPGVRENTIREMPEKGKRVTKGVSLKIVENNEEPKPKKEEKPKQEIVMISYAGVDSKEILRQLENRAETHIVQLRNIMRQMYEKLRVDNKILPGHVFMGRLGTLQRLINKFIEIYPLEVILPDGPYGDKSNAFEGEYSILDEEDKESE